MTFRIPVVEVLAGTTWRFKWISSGTTPSALTSALINGSETVISSVSATASGDGHFYAHMDLPASGGNYINEWIGIIGVNTWRSRQVVITHRLEVD